MSAVVSPDTSVEANKERCLQMVAAWNRWDPQGVIDHWAPDVVHYSENEPVDTDEMIGRMKNGLAAFPDLHLDVQSILGDGNRVSLRITVTATHKSEYLAVPPTGKKVTWHLVEELRFADGKVVEHWDVLNYLPLLKDLGKVPADL